MNRDETKTILGILVAVFPRNIEATPTLLNVWQSILADHSFDEVHKALKMFLSTDAQFPPLPGQLHQAILKSKTVPVSQVWGDLLKLASSSKSLDDVKKIYADDVGVLKAIQALGWDRIRYADVEKELPFLRNAFERMYIENSKHDQNQQILIKHEEAKQITDRFKAMPLRVLGNAK